MCEASSTDTIQVKTLLYLPEKSFRNLHLVLAEVPSPEASVLSSSCASSSLSRSLYSLQTTL